MPKRTNPRLTLAVCTALAGGALNSAAYAAPSTTLPTTAPVPAAMVPAQPMPGAATQPAAVITAPAPRRSSADQSQSYTTAVTAKTVAASTTSPATMPATAPTMAPTTAQAVTVPPLNPAPPASQPADIAADAQLAEHMCSLAQSQIPMKVPSNDLWPIIWQQSGALLSAACKLNPAESRFSRLLADVMLQSHDAAGAIDALGKARKADPTDQGVQVQVIDLYVNRMETAPQKIAYLKDLMGRPSIPEPIRSHAGVTCAALLQDRGETAMALNVLSEALRLNPYNATGLRMRYEMLPAAASNFERSEALMEILRANPAQPEVAAALADRLASVGIVDDSIPWFDLASRLYARRGRPNLDLALNLACELFIGRQMGAATNLSDQLCALSPNASGNWFLKVLLARARGDDAGLQRAMQQSINALSNALVQQLPPTAGQPAPTTRPIDTVGPYPLPDLGAPVDQMLKADAKPESAQKRRDFELALADLATLHVYFAQKPGDAANLIAALEKLNPTDPALSRLRGFSALYNGRPDEAKTAFEACRGKDPLGELGLVRLQAGDPAQTQAASLAGRQLLNAHPSGLLGAFLVDGLRDLRVEIIPSKEADALQQQVKHFPTDWLAVIDQPSNFYALRVDPIALARDYGEPLLARLTVLNLTSSPLPIGVDGVLKPDLWFNARVRGFDSQQYGAIAYDRLAGPLVLGPRDSFSQTIRLDQGALQQLLKLNFAQTIEVVGDVMTNPQPSGNGQVAPGPAGYHVVFAHPFSRNAEPMNSLAAQKSLTKLSFGAPQEKFAAIDLVAVYLRAMAANPNPNDPNQRQTLGTLQDSLHKAATDPTPAVAAWAALSALQVTPSAGIEQQIVDLSQDPDWRHRQVALLAADTLSPTAQRRIAASLAADPEPSVRTAADARVKYLDVMAAVEKK